MPLSVPGNCGVWEVPPPGLVAWKLWEACGWLCPARLWVPDRAGASLWGQGTHLGPQGVACKGGRKAVTKWAAAAEAAPGVQRVVATPSPPHPHPGPADPVLGGEVHPEELGEGLQAFQPWLGRADVYRKCLHWPVGRAHTARHTQDTHMTPTGAPSPTVHWTCTPMLHACSAFYMHTRATHTQHAGPAHPCSGFLHLHATHCNRCVRAPAHTCSLRPGPCGPRAVLPASPTVIGLCWHHLGSALLGVGAAAEPALHWGPDIGAQ
uniref:Uncharacterized protein n=1 Tax=Myotis myotis TaxID=51298 RepID=A0A7J7QW76_MYOMY|nr:hypothetical protein mMyoMyo1_011287 [Myotis myotis]